MIVDKIQGWWDAGCPSTPEAIAHAEWVMQGVGWGSFKRNFIEMDTGSDRKPVTLSSNFYCARQIAYDLMKMPKDPIQLRGRNVFTLGDMIEAATIAKIVLAFSMYDHMMVLHPTPKSGEYRVYMDLDGDKIGGRPDLVFSCNGKIYFADVKSMNEFGFKKTMAGKDIPEADKDTHKAPYYSDTFGRRTQIVNYAKAEGHDSTFVVGVCKSTMHIFEEEIFVAREERIASVVEPSYAHAKAMVAKGEVPNRPPWATEKLIKGSKPWKGEIEHIRCGYCGHRKTCWPDHELAPLKGQVKYRRNLSDEEASNFQSNPAYTAK